MGGINLKTTTKKILSAIMSFVLMLIMTCGFSIIAQAATVAVGTAKGTQGYDYISVELTAGDFSPVDADVKNTANWTLTASGGQTIMSIDKGDSKYVVLTLSSVIGQGDTFQLQAATGVFEAGTDPFAPLDVNVTVPVPATGTATATAGTKDIAITLSSGTFAPNASTVQTVSLWTLGGASAAANPITSVTYTDAATTRTHVTITLTNNINIDDTYTISASQGVFVNIAVAPFATPLPVTVQGENVCEINGNQYAVFDDALADVATGQTIKLLKDVSYASKIEASNKSFIIDVSGFMLTVNVSGDDCVSAINGQSITIEDSAGGGSLEVNGSGMKNGYGINGLYADGTASAINVTVPATINVTGQSNIGVHARSKGVVDAKLTDINNSAGQGYVYGLIVYEGGTAHVGNITVAKSGNWCIGVYVSGDPLTHGQTAATVDGAISSGDEYIRMGVSTLNMADETLPTTKAGYRTYKLDSAANANTVWVKIPSMTDAEKVAADKAALTFDAIKNQNTAPSNITGNLVTLPATGANGSAINWSSSDPSTVSSSGSVTRPANGTGDKTVTLTATITSGAASDTVVFSLTVKEMTQTADPAPPQTPTISPNGGAFTGSTTVTITGSGGTVYYTTDGSNPTTGSTQYTAPFTLSQSATVKAAVYSSSNKWSGVASATFTITASPGGSSGGGGGGGGTSAKPEKPAAQVLDSSGNVIESIATNLDNSTGVVAVEVNSGSLANAFDKLKADAKGVKTVVVDIPEIEGAKIYEPILPASFLTSGDTTKAVEIKTGIAAVTVSGNMLTTANTAGAQNVSLKIAAGDKTGLDAAVQAQIGDRPVIELNLKINGQKVSWHNESAPVTVTVPYTPAADELKNPEHITVWYIDGSGRAATVPSGRYDPETGTVTFTATHFSYYAVAYVHKTFSDLGSVEWARKSIEVMASKGIINGTGSNTYSPAANISRADYLVLLIKTLGLTADFDGNFDDVQRGTYYYEAAGIAKKLGIAAGSGSNRFNPKENISRQDMMALTARALEKFENLKASGNPAVLDKFSDKRDIAGYAVESLATLVKEGLITGSADKLNPRANTTRAEAAVFLYRIYLYGLQRI
jgi:hypothetical protein